MKTKKVSIIPTFHHDIAYLKPERDYHDMATAILDRAVELMQKDSHYTFTVEQAYFFQRYWQEHPQMHGLLQELTENGQLHFAPGFWSVPDMCMINGESVYQQATYGKRCLAESVGYRPQTAFIADCWGHHGQLPQILTQCGYDYYVFSRCMEESFGKENFRWKGIDGSVINAHWLSSGYAGVDFKDKDSVKVNAEELHWEAASKEGILSILGKNAAFCGEDDQLIPAGGDAKMPARSSLEIVSQLQKDPQMPKLGFSSMEEALQGIAYSDKPVYGGEFVSSMKGSFATNIEIKQWNNRVEQLLYALEVLSVMRGEPLDFSREWKTTLKNQFHDILCGTICDEAMIQVMDEYKACGEALEEKRRQLSGEGKKAWFNPLPFPVEQLLPGENPALVRAKALSYGEITQQTARPAPLPNSFDNPFYHAQIDEKGYITSLVEKKSGQELVNRQSAPFGCLQMQADNGDNWVEFEYPSEYPLDKYTVNIPDPWDRTCLQQHRNVKLREGGVLSCQATWLGDEILQITQTGILKYWEIRIPFTTTVTFSKTSPRITYHTELDSTARHVRIRVGFPAAVEDGQVRHQIPFGIVPRGEGAQPAAMFMDYQNKKAGLCLINRGIPANNTENGIMMLTLFRSVAMEYKCQSELSFNLGKRITADYAIVPHGADEDGKLWENALALNCPLVETTEQPLPDIRVEQAYLSALRYDGEDIFLRLYNGTAENKQATVYLPNNISQYAFTDGCMEPNTMQHPCNGAIHVALKPWEVKGLRLTKG